MAFGILKVDQLSVQNKEEEQQPATLERTQNVIQLVSSLSFGSSVQ
jgi:hypothetical protein